MKKLKLNESLVVAKRVLSAIRLPDAVAEECDVVGYENGREHGLCIKCYYVKDGGNRPVTICFAENRNSDQIVVYVSTPGERFDANTNIPTARAYEAAKYFDYGEYAKAANFITSKLR